MLKLPEVLGVAEARSEMAHVLEEVEKGRTFQTYSQSPRLPRAPTMTENLSRESPLPRLAAGSRTCHPSSPTTQVARGMEDGRGKTRRAHRRLEAAQAALCVARTGPLRGTPPVGTVRLFSGRARHRDRSRGENALP